MMNFDYIKLTDNWSNAINKINRNLRLLEEKTGPIGNIGNPGFVGLPGKTGKPGESGLVGSGDKLKFININEIIEISGEYYLEYNKEDYLNFLVNLKVISEEEKQKIIDNDEDIENINKRIEKFEDDALTSISVQLIDRNSYMIYLITNIVKAEDELDNYFIRIFLESIGVLVPTTTGGSGESMFKTFDRIIPGNQIRGILPNKLNDTLALINVYLYGTNLDTVSINSSVDNSVAIKSTFSENFNEQIYSNIIKDYNHKLILTNSIATEDSYHSPLILLGQINNGVNTDSNGVVVDSDKSSAFSAFFSVGIKVDDVGINQVNELAFISRGELNYGENNSLHKYNIAFYADGLYLNSRTNNTKKISFLPSIDYDKLILSSSLTIENVLEIANKVNDKFSINLDDSGASTITVGQNKLFSIKNGIGGQDMLYLKSGKIGLNVEPATFDMYLKPSSSLNTLSVKLESAQGKETSIQFFGDSKQWEIKRVANNLAIVQGLSSSYITFTPTNYQFHKLTTGVVMSSANGILSSSTNIPSSNGGTGFNTYAKGDIIYANATNTLAKLSINSGNVLIATSGGLPAWGKLDLSKNSSQIQNTLSLENGGTGMTITEDEIVYDGSLVVEANKSGIITYYKGERSLTLTSPTNPANSGFLFYDSSSFSKQFSFQPINLSLTIDGGIGLPGGAITGILQTVNGGTNNNSFSNNGVVYYSNQKLINSTGITITKISGGFLKYNLNVNGNVYADTFYGDLYEPSDIRLKENLTRISTIINDINYYRFNFKKDPTKIRYGVIAQEIEDIYPELVHTNDDGIKSVKYTDLYSLEIAKLKDEIFQLKKELKELKK